MDQREEEEEEEDSFPKSILPAAETAVSSSLRWTAEESPLLPACRKTGSQELSCGDTKYSCILATASRVVVTGKNSQQSHQGWPGGEPCLTGERCPSWLWKGKDKPPYTPCFVSLCFSYLVTSLPFSPAVKSPLDSDPVKPCFWEGFSLKERQSGQQLYIFYAPRNWASS